MTPLRQRMVEDMQLRGLSEKTQEAYVRAVRQLAEHYGKSPQHISDEELRQYFLHLTNVKQFSPSAVQVALYGISSSSSIHSEKSGPRSTWCVRVGKRSCRWCSV